MNPINAVQWNEFFNEPKIKTIMYKYIKFRSPVILYKEIELRQYGYDFNLFDVDDIYQELFLRLYRYYVKLFTTPIYLVIEAERINKTIENFVIKGLEININFLLKEQTRRLKICKYGEFFFLKKEVKIKDFINLIVEKKDLISEYLNKIFLGLTEKQNLDKLLEIDKDKAENFIIANLNDLLEWDDFYQKEIFVLIELRDITLSYLNGKKGWDSIARNRLLLEDSYPNAIRSYKEKSKEKINETFMARLIISDEDEEGSGNEKKDIVDLQQANSSNILLTKEIEEKILNAISSLPNEIMQLTVMLKYFKREPIRTSMHLFPDFTYEHVLHQLHDAEMILYNKLNSLEENLI